MARPISFDPEEALEKAMELFWRRGYHEVSVEDIVQATGLNRHSLYARYGSKFGLLKAALQRYRQIVVERIKEVLSGQGPARQRIEALLELRHPSGEDDVFREMLDRGCFALRMTAELRDKHPDLGIDLDEFGDVLESRLADVIKQGQEAGEFRKDRTPEDLASVLAGGFMLPLFYSPAAKRTDVFVQILD